MGFVSDHGGTRHHLAQRRIRNLLDPLVELSFSVGAVSPVHGRAAQALKTPLAEAAASLCCTDALWRDEARYPRDGIANRVWAAVQPLPAVLAIHLSRARCVMLGQRTGARRQGSQRRVQTALARGLHQRQCSRTAKACANILEPGPAPWTSTSNVSLAPTNNAVEPELRRSVHEREISAPTLSLHRGQVLARGFSVHENCARARARSVGAHAERGPIVHRRFGAAEPDAVQWRPGRRANGLTPASWRPRGGELQAPSAASGGRISR